MSMLRMCTVLQHYVLFLSAVEDDVLSLDSFKQDSECNEGHTWVMCH